MSKLPTEWKSALEGLAPVEIVKRVEGLVQRGQTAPLTSDREWGPFILFVLGDSIEEVSQKMNIPVDVLYLTAITYHWKEKKTKLMEKGESQLIALLQKKLVNQLLVATQASIAKQVGEILAGRMSPDKCPLIPKNLNGLKLFMEIVSEINNLTTDNTSNSSKNVINAQNVQIVQPLSPPDNSLEEKRKKILDSVDD